MPCNYESHSVYAVSPEGGVWVNPTLINGSHGGNATFTCFALGGPQNVFSWKNLRSNSVIANDSELMIFDIMASDGGQYQCSAENPAGEDSINVTLNGNTCELNNSIIVAYEE